MKKLTNKVLLNKIGDNSKNNHVFISNSDHEKRNKVISDFSDLILENINSIIDPCCKNEIDYFLDHNYSATIDNNIKVLSYGYDCKEDMDSYPISVCLSPGQSCRPEGTSSLEDWGNRVCDCEKNCVLQSTVESQLGNGFCNDQNFTGINLNF